MTTRVDLAVIYRWSLHPGKEEQFRQAWERATELYIRSHGALGSRLHQSEDGTWVAYAQWPSRAAWEQAHALGSPDAEAARQMRDAEADVFPPLLLTPVADHLLPGAA
jgi:quinol monooxygenase YgiN